MTRRSTRPAWAPNPECDAALARITRVAHLSAASLFGEKPADDPGADASARALMMASGMMYFLFRIDPKDLAALCTGPGSTAEWTYRPFADGAWNRRPALDGWLVPAPEPPARDAAAPAV